MSAVGDHPPQEPDRLPFLRLLTVLGLAVMIMVVLCLWALANWRSVLHQRRPDKLRAERSLPAPRERQGVEEGIFSLTAPALRLRQQQEAHLSGFGWVDRAQGVVQIPINDAIDLAVKRAP